MLKVAHLFIIMFWILLAEQLLCHVLGGAAAVAHGEDYCGTATHDVATGWMVNKNDLAYSLMLF